MLGQHQMQACISFLLGLCLLIGSVRLPNRPGNKHPGLLVAMLDLFKRFV